MYESLTEATKFHAINQDNWVGEALAEYKHEIYNLIKEILINKFNAKLKT